VVFIDRGSTSGVQKGMAVITPDGIVGKVVDSFPVAAQVLLITDQTFAAGVISQKNHTRGTLKGEGKAKCILDYVQNEEKVDIGEWFYTTGDDRVFPKGLPVGQVASVRPGKNVKEIYVTPSGFQNGFEEVLVVLEGIHQAIPEPQTASGETHMLPPPPPDKNASDTDNSGESRSGTEMDRLLDRYKKIGEAEGITYGVAGSKPPDFNINPDDPKYKKFATPPPMVITTPGAPKPVAPASATAPSQQQARPAPLQQRPVQQQD
jgi:rod shape-determining protein MreC